MMPMDERGKPILSMPCALAEKSGSGRRFRQRPAGFILLPAIAMLGFILLYCAGCGDPARVDQPAGDRVAYIEYKPGTSRIILAGNGNNAGHSLLMWPGKADRVTFSNDGRFMAITLQKDDGAPYALIAATDGSGCWYPPGDLVLGLSFSPDSSKLAYYSQAVEETAENTIEVIDSANGSRKIIGRGAGLKTPVWANDSYIVYQDEKEGLIYGNDIASGETRPLTSRSRHFILEPLPVSYKQEKIAIVEMPPFKNIWSLDVRTGESVQVTNNNRFQNTPAYLPGTDRIVFWEYFSGDLGNSAELCTIRDYGDDFTPLTGDFEFDATFSISPVSGRIVYEHAEEADPKVFRETLNSIRIINNDGSGQSLVAESGSSSLLKPVFVNAAGWRLENPPDLNAAIGNKADGQFPVTINVTNSGDSVQETVLRLFPGTGLNIAGVSGDKPGEDTASVSAADTPLFDKSVRRMEWRLKLEPKESKKIMISVSGRVVASGTQNTALAITLASPGAPPHMLWWDFA